MACPHRIQNHPSIFRPVPTTKRGVSRKAATRAGRGLTDGRNNAVFPEFSEPSVPPLLQTTRIRHTVDQDGKEPRSQAIQKTTYFCGEGDFHRNAQIFLL